MTKETSPQATQSRPYPAEKARGGEIVLRTSIQRWVFIAGLAGTVLLALVLSFTLLP
jgi:hypothetical protein